MYPYAAETRLRARGYVRHPCPVIGSGGSRLCWDELPPAVHDWVGGVLGAPVVEAVSQPGGFSPGSADRVRTAGGARAFVKAGCDPGTAAMHRREATITAALPPLVPASALLGSFDADGWVALVLTDVDGRTPHLPWRPDELETVLDMLARLATTGTPCPVPDLPPARDGIGHMFGGARRLAADAITFPGLDLPALADVGIDALDGDSLVHFDTRADNILLTSDGAVLVDWPHACRGPAWFDTLGLLMEVDRFGGHDVDALLATHPATRDVDRTVLDGALAGLAGGFLDRARQPSIPGMPTIREFQRVQGEAVLAWLQRRLSAVRTTPVP